jgi:hypothetical protein
VANRKNRKQQERRSASNPFGPSVLVARGVDPVAIAKVMASMTRESDTGARFEPFNRGSGAARGSGSAAVIDPETGEVRGMQEGVDYVARRCDLPPVSEAPTIPGAELFDVDEVEGIRIVKPIGRVSHSALAAAVSQFIGYTRSMVGRDQARQAGYYGLVPDPRKAADVQAVWNLLPGRRPEPTPLTAVIRRGGIPVGIALEASQ